MVDSCSIQLSLSHILALFPSFPFLNILLLLYFLLAHAHTKCLL